MKRTALHQTLFAILIVMSCPLAHSTQVVLDSVKDNTVYEPSVSSPAETSNGAGATFIVGSTLLDVARRSVIYFDIASVIPAGATIDGVTLTLYCDKASNSTDFSVEAHPLLADWGEGSSNADSRPGEGVTPTTGDVTWTRTFWDTALWASPGGDYAAPVSATTLVGAPLASYDWSGVDLIADVQGWLDDPATDFGWILIGDESQPSTTKRFLTREAVDPAQRPVLTIDYTAAGPIGGCCLGTSCIETAESNCIGLGGFYQGDGSDCSPSPCGTALGACCSPDASCQEISDTVCAAQGGTFRGDATSCSTEVCLVELEPYVDALPIPAVAVPTIGSAGAAASYEISIVEFDQQLHRDLPPTTVWGFDDGTNGPAYPGPTIEATPGETVFVDWKNELRDTAAGGQPYRTDHFLDIPTSCIHGASDDAKTVIHLHGAHVAEEFDGYPEYTYTPGFSEIYEYPNNQLPATLWYHDHALGITRANVYMGLAGFYLLRDAAEQALSLPSGEFEIPLAIQDRSFDEGGVLSYPSLWEDHFAGEFNLVNGKVWPYLEVKRGKYRFRILNGAGSRTYRMTLAPPSGTLDFTVIGTEGGLLETPASGISEITIGPGERIDVVIDFSSYNPSDVIDLVNDAPLPFPGSVGVGVISEVMQFRVVGGVGAFTAPLSPTLTTIVPIDENESVIDRDFTLARGTVDACGYSPWLINGLAWDDITEYPDLDTVEVWSFVNLSTMSHPMHMHLVMFQVLSRGGISLVDGDYIQTNPVAPSPEEAGWKDTVMVAPFEMVRVIARFETFKGKFAYHCHILEHEDHEMMRQFQTVDCGDSVLDPSEDCDDGNVADADGCSAVCVAEGPLTELTVSSSDAPDPVRAGDVIDYTMTVTNSGTADALDVEVSTILASDTTLVSTIGCSEDPLGAPLCSLGTVTAASSAQFVLSARVATDAGAAVVAQFSVDGSSPESNIGNNDELETTQVQGPDQCADRGDLVLDATDTGTGSLFFSQNSISAGTGYQVQNGEDVQFRAKASIELSNDFTIAAGAIFEAVLDPALTCP